MDLKNFETTTTYAIQAVYMEYWRTIPERYRLLEKAQVPLKEKKPRSKSKPLSYKEVEKEGEEFKEERSDMYERYCEMMNSEKWFDLTPFYDPQLDFENRLHYKIAEIEYPDRQKPWFIITWNMGNGLLKSSLTRRRFQTCSDKTPGGEDVTFDFINTDMDLTFAIYSNSLQALLELQENIIISKREKCTVTTATHSIIGKFPVSLDTIDSTIAKLPRDKGTLCVLTLNVKIDFPIIGNVKYVKEGIIKEIHSEIDGVVDIQSTINVTPETDVTAHVVLARDIITPETPDYFEP
jgi:hypothetical protein